MKASADLARSITRRSSKQTYYTARLLVDRGLLADCYRAYGYFRWADDVIDAPTPSGTAPLGADGRISFIKRQKELISCLYENGRAYPRAPEEEIVADLINHADGGRGNGGLESFIRNFMAILEFDANRKGKLIGEPELTWYSACLGKAVTDCIQYFIGNSHAYSDGVDRYKGATAAHITHMLRDMVSDTAEGYINIPREYLEAHAIGPGDVHSPAYRSWVRGRVEQARQYFQEGKRYLDEMHVLRCKLAGFWYCARFETVLDAIERDGYVLREQYAERHRLSTWVRMVWLTVSVTSRHLGRRLRRSARSLMARVIDQEGRRRPTMADGR